MTNPPASDSRKSRINLVVFFSFLFAMAFAIFMLIVWQSSSFRKDNALSFNSKDVAELFCSKYKEAIGHIYNAYICDYESVSRTMKDSLLPQLFPDAEYVVVARDPEDYRHGNAWVVKGNDTKRYTGGYHVAGTKLLFNQCLRQLMPEARNGTLSVDLYRDSSGVEWIRFIFDFRYHGDRFEIEFIIPHLGKHLMSPKNSIENKDNRVEPN